MNKKTIIFISVIFVIFWTPFFITALTNDNSDELLNAEFDSVISKVEFERGISIEVDKECYLFAIDNSYPEMYLPESYFVKIIKKGNSISKKSGNNFFTIFDKQKQVKIFFN